MWYLICKRTFIFNSFPTEIITPQTYLHIYIYTYKTASCLSCIRGLLVTHADVCGIFAEAWYKGLSTSNITAGFRATGVYPFNQYAEIIMRESQVVSLE